MGFLRNNRSANDEAAGVIKEPMGPAPDYLHSAIKVMLYAVFNGVHATYRRLP